MTEREILQREIAAILDRPSLYMGGPSQNSLRRADAIIRYLEGKNLLVSERVHGETTSKDR